MHVGVVAQRDNARAAELADLIRRNLEAAVSLDETTAESLDRPGTAPADLGDCDLVVSIGGDGTFLFTAREVTPTPVMGVNLGEVGFLNVVSPGDAVETIRRVTGRFREGDLDCQVLPQIRASGDDWTLPGAVNEVAILGPQRGRNHGLGVEIRVDGKLFAGGHADGTLVSTPTGSTAYNLSEGGPLVHPDVGAFLITEMCARDPMPSLAVPTDVEIAVRVEAADQAVVVADGRMLERVEPPTKVRLRRGTEPVRIAGPPLEFFAAMGKLA
jgi:NAD+ kinase